MSLVALSLVLLSALCHATWNLFAKRVPSGIPFVWLFDTLAVVVYAPFAIWLLAVRPVAFGWPHLLMVLGSSLLHLGYFLSLQRGYRTGDLSLVYPLARGTGPLLSTLGAIVLLGERPTAWALVGGLLVVVSVFLLAGGDVLVRHRAEVPRALRFALLTGAFIASYTLFDALAVTTFLLPPLLFNWLGNAGRAVLLTPPALRHWPEVRLTWRKHRGAVVVVAVLSPLAYILVLTALVFTPVSYVAPAREVSILVAAVMGASLLNEGQVMRRLLAASLIVVGVVLLTLG
jgi:drug/metabolite transporter (DMT)-like permease